MFQEYKATKTLTFNMQGFMRTKAIQNFYELDNFGGLFLSVNKSILKKKANIILSVNDLLRTNQVSFKLNQGNVSAAGSRINDTRRVGITIGYALAPLDGPDANSLLKRADAAMYAGKQAGRHCLTRGQATVGLSAA